MDDVTSISIDLNVRLAGGETYSGFEHITDGSIPEVGEVVRVIEPETELQGKAEVRRVDPQKRLIYLAVDWAALRPPVPRRRETEPVFYGYIVSKVAHHRRPDFRFGDMMIQVKNASKIHCNFGHVRATQRPMQSDDLESLVNSAR